MAIDPKRVKEIFLEAAEQPDEAARAAFLDRSCGSDAELRVRVEVLLRSHVPDGSFLGTPAAVVPDPHHAATRAFAPDADHAATHTGGGTPGDAEKDEVPLGFLAPATRPDSLGRIGHYEILQVLGQGAFGIVFRAFDDVLHRIVAVKVLSPQMAATSPARKRFLREARTSGAVRHENVVQVHEVGETPLPYLVMEFIPGETLQQRLNRVGPVEATEVVRIGRQIAEGLAAAHATDLIHRDIKPGNILLESGAQRVKITDFGLARAADDASISQSGIIAGTPMYMAPEQAKGETLDQRADLFSLGSVLYQMAAGRAPFRANGTVAVLKRVAEDTPRNIREITPETPQWLCDIIAKLHAKNPDDRYQSAREVAEVLADCEAQLKANAKLKDFSRIPLRKSTERRSRWWALAAAIIPILAGGVVLTLKLLQLQPDHTRYPNEQQKPVRVTNTEPLPATFKNSIGMEFVIVPKGRSWLGGFNGIPGDKEVEIRDDFYLGKYVVTQEEWTQMMGENPSHFSRKGGGMDAVKDINDADLKRFPVENVSWDQCQTFVAKLNELEKETGWVYRLPKEVEWEYACRGGPMSDKLDGAFSFYFTKPTNTLLPDQANFEQSNGLKRTCKVGSYEANPLGLFDMHGNVWEWCDDTYIVPGASLRVRRGGSWGNSEGCRARDYNAGPPSDRTSHLGLRLARVPSGAPSPEAKASPLAIAPFTDADVKRISVLPAAEQVEEVCKELMRRNPGFDGKMEHKIEAGVVTEFRIVADKVTDIAPIRVWSALRLLSCLGTGTNTTGPNGLLANLTPLEGMNLAGLTHLNLIQTKVTDAGMVYFKDCKELGYLNLNYTKVTDAGLANFKNCQDLTILDLNNTKVTDAGLANFKDCKALTQLLLGKTKVSEAGLANFKGMPLSQLWIEHTSITDLTPLQGMPLEEIRLTPKNIRQGLDILRDMKSLKTIGIEWDQSWPAAEFWDRYDKGEFGVAPFTDANVQRITALPAAEQVEEVRKELKRRNPGYDGRADLIVEGDAVRVIRVRTDTVTDISPLRVFKTPRILDLSGFHDAEFRGHGQLADLTSLAGMDLTGLTNLLLGNNTKLTDESLGCFKGCKDLENLTLWGTTVGDAGLDNFKECKKLYMLSLDGTKVTDAGLALFKDCKNLKYFQLSRTQVTDAGMAHLKGCKGLTHLTLDGTPVTDAGLAHIAGLAGLTYLNLANTKVTAKGVEELAKALPKCKITWDGGVIEPK